MLRFLKKIFGKTVPKRAPIPAPVQVPQKVPPVPKTWVKPAPPVAKAKVAAAGDSIQIAIRELLPKFPENIRAIVANRVTNGESVAIPVALVLEQLPKGSIKIRYSDLVRGSSPAILPPSKSGDSILVELPLREILSQLQPHQLPRRSGQRAGEVPAEIVSPFLSSAAEKAAARVQFPPGSANLAPPVASLNLPPIVQKTDAFAGAALAQVDVATRNQTAAPISAPPVSTDAACISFPLSALGPAFNSALRAQFPGHSSKTLNLPRALIEPELKRGKLVFPLKLVAAWLDPARDPKGIEDDQNIELPLKVIAPMFFRSGTARTVRPAEELLDAIPDVFRGAGLSPIALAEPVAPRKPEAENSRAPASLAITREEAPQIVPVLEVSEPPKTVSALIGDLASCAGIEGAVAATLDGFLVAGAGFAGLNQQSFAAFGPHMYNRLLQYGGDLQLGDARTLTIYFDKRPLRLFRAGRLLIIVAGRGSEPFPEAEIERLGAKLSQANT